MGGARPSSFYRRHGKRALDLALALPVALVTLPISLAVALAVRLTLGSPVIFRQRRPGRAAEPLTLLKFRTMTDANDETGRLLPDSQRLTRLGRWLRRTSLDELPEVVNVLVGNMSLVGPRPLRMEYLGRYSPQQSRRHEVSPGITGWAQVNGRNALTWERKFELDLWYVDHLSLGLDLRILMLTVGAVLRGRGVAAEGHATMPEFRGSAPGKCDPETEVGRRIG